MQGKDGAGGGGGENGSEICMQERSGAEEDEEGRGGSGGGEGRGRKEGVRKRGAMFIERLLPAPSLPHLLLLLPIRACAMRIPKSPSERAGMAGVGDSVEAGGDGGGDLAKLIWHRH